MKKFLFLFFLPVIGLAAINLGRNPAFNDAKAYVLMDTEYGEIKVFLYDETSLHKENFLKNVKDGLYDSLLFHRVINTFMVQGGDPDSKNAGAGTMLGNGGLNYTVPAEFKKQYFHKRGALAAAREGDDVNPQKASSSTQFYIVQGKVFTDEMLDQMEQRVDQMTKTAIFFELLNQTDYKEQKKSFVEAKASNNQQKMMEIFNGMSDSITKIFDERGGAYKYTKEQREVYKTIGGAPHLDGNYTVFGEVVSGMEIVDSIAKAEVDGNNRPLKDIRIISMKVIYK